MKNLLPTIHWTTTPVKPLGIWLLMVVFLLLSTTSCCHGFVHVSNTPSGHSASTFGLYLSNGVEEDSQFTSSLEELSSSSSSIATSSPTQLRRTMLRNLVLVGGAAVVSSSAEGVPMIALAASSSKKRTTVDDGNLPDLPPEAQRSYMQYRAALQTSADYYIFELQDSIKDTDQWGEVGQLFASQGARGGQGQPNRIERDFVNPMRILELSMPPEEADALREARFQFEASMQKIQKATAGIRRDLPVEIMPDQVVQAKQGWEDGRKALNEYFVTLNQATGLKDELTTIPPAGPNQFVEYGRSQRKFFDLMKKTKLCQNRGGTTLANTWGGLMVSGYMQDSCGIPDMTDYFFQ